MRRRPSSRLLVLDWNDRVLLFHFVFTHGALAGQDYWATPGGALEPGETFEQAARRELFEETGLVIDAISDPVADKEFILQLTHGERVTAEERFFVVRATPTWQLSRDHWTRHEHEVMVDYRWWSISDLTATSEIVFPEDLADILSGLGVTRGT